MSVTIGSGTSLRDVWQRQRDLMSELRDVVHWRRLVAARLDLAIAAVTAIDEPAVRALPAAPTLPAGLRAIVGLPPCDGAFALGETALLVGLRDALRDLDEYAFALRESTDDATRALVAALEFSQLDSPIH